MSKTSSQSLRVPPALSQSVPASLTPLRKEQYKIGRRTFLTIKVAAVIFAVSAAIIAIFSIIEYYQELESAVQLPREEFYLCSNENLGVTDERFCVQSEAECTHTYRATFSRAVENEGTELSLLRSLLLVDLIALLLFLGGLVGDFCCSKKKCYRTVSKGVVFVDILCCFFGIILIVLAAVTLSNGVDRRTLLVDEVTYLPLSRYDYDAELDYTRAGVGRQTIPSQCRQHTSCLNCLSSATCEWKDDSCTLGFRSEDFTCPTSGVKRVVENGKQFATDFPLYPPKVTVSFKNSSCSTLGLKHDEFCQNESVRFWTPPGEFVDWPRVNCTDYTFFQSLILSELQEIAGWKTILITIFGSVATTLGCVSTFIFLYGSDFESDEEEGGNGEESELGVRVVNAHEMDEVVAGE
eukprot:TRINITY_DN3623_c0_g1_i2.p1 TRINITY_DN3623_c0_g1~~TRINITY_DN3623_c0_g1_i2.p1  ORF type:complete len:409 (-),score=81.65 TRINITY_DN3623_c0_g1_i2:329-1555(-)